MKIYDSDCVLTARHNFHKIKMAVNEHIASTGRTIIDNLPLSPGDIRIFAKTNNLCDRMYYFSYPDTNILEICVMEYIQKDISDEGYLGDELDFETWKFATSLEDYYLN